MTSLRTPRRRGARVNDSVSTRRVTSSSTSNPPLDCLSCLASRALSLSDVARNFRQGVRQSVAFLSVHSRSAALCVGL